MSRNASPAAAFVERRASDRKPTALLAFAQNRDGARFPCQVKNISDRGAMLEFLGSQAVLLEDVRAARRSAAGPEPEEGSEDDAPRPASALGRVLGRRRNGRAG